MEREEYLNEIDSDVCPKRPNSWIHNTDFKPLPMCVLKKS